MTDNSDRQLVEVVDQETGELPAIIPSHIGGLPIFDAEAAARLRAQIEQYQQVSLTDDDYVFYASWVYNGRRKRKGFDQRRDAEVRAQREHGRVEQVKRAQAYDKLAMPLEISSQPAPEFDRDSRCVLHEGNHLVYVRGWQVTASTGRSVADRGVMATCERLSSDDHKLLWSDRMEHDAAATAQRRAYVRAMKTLLGFGEPQPYLPERGSTPPTTAPSARPQPVPNDEDEPEDDAAAWSALWATSRELGLGRAALHHHFGLESKEGALKQYAQAQAEQEQRPLAETVRRLRETIVSAPCPCGKPAHTPT